MPNYLKMGMSDILDRARILTSKQVYGGVSAVTLSKVIDRPNSGNGSVSGGSSSNVGAFKGQCFRCGGPHMIRYCREQRVRCFRCNIVGHIASKCPEINSGNE